MIVLIRIEYISCRDLIISHADVPAEPTYLLLSGLAKMCETRINYVIDMQYSSSVIISCTIIFILTSVVLLPNNGGEGERDSKEQCHVRATGGISRWSGFYIIFYS